MKVIATAGHVDHGKSTLVRALTGMEPDRWEQERRRRLTIDLGFAWTDLTGSDGGRVTVAFVDVPGHERFIGNMLAGAGTAPHALFVVAADDGWSAQSQEHLEILSLLESAGLAVAVTKADVAGPERTLEVAADIRRRAAGTCLDGAPIIAVDPVAGDGMEALANTVADMVAVAPDVPCDGRTRLWIDRAFTIRGAGTVVTGTLQGGGLSRGQQVRILPSGKPAYVRRLEALGTEVEEASPGDRVGVNLRGIDRQDVRRGCCVVGSPDWRVTSRLDAVVRVLPGQHMRTQGAWSVHVGTARVAASVRPLLGDLDDGAVGPVRIRLDEPVALQHGDRLVLRDVGRQATVGGAIVLDPDPPPRSRRSHDRMRHADLLHDLAASRDPSSRLEKLLDLSGGVSGIQDLLARAGVVALPTDCRTIRVMADHAVAASVLNAWQAAILEAVKTTPAASGMFVDRLVSLADTIGCPRPLVRPVVRAMIDSGLLRHRLGVVLTCEQDPSHIRARAERADNFLAALGECPLRPPDPEELTRELSMTRAEVHALIESGKAIRAGPILFVPDAVDAAVATLRHARRVGERFTVADARTTLGSTRKFVVPLLEHLRQRGTTARDGNHHWLVD